MNNNQLTIVFSKLRDLNEVPMKIKTRYYISKIYSYVTDKLQPYFIAEKDLVKKYGKKGSDGEYEKAENGGIVLNVTDECNREYSELQLIEVNISDAPKISLDYLIEAGLELTESEMEAFNNFIE